jgi:hypothetical protein
MTTRTGTSVEEAITERIKGFRLENGSGGKKVTFLHHGDAARIAATIMELLPRGGGAKTWIGYALDRTTVIQRGNSKREIKASWAKEIGVPEDEASKDIKTIYSSNGIYRFSYTSPDLSSHDIWIVEAGSEGFGAERDDD